MPNRSTHLSHRFLNNDFVLINHHSHCGGLRDLEQASPDPAFRGVMHGRDTVFADPHGNGSESIFDDGHLPENLLRFGGELLPIAIGYFFRERLRQTTPKLRWPRPW